MMRSLYSGVSGLRIHQTKMDVIGNNIANVNTVGFKSSSVNFSDVFYQTIQSATGPNEKTGAAGKNAMQIGLGSTVASITTSITQTGGSQRTDNPFDVMITGDSFFVVNSAGTNYFTKAGAFNVDPNGTLCTATGATVMGWEPVNDSIVVSSVKPLKIMAPENMFSPPEATTESYIAGNIDSKDSQIVKGRNVNVEFYDNLGHSYTAELSIKQVADPTNNYTVAVSDIKDEYGVSIFAIKEEVDGAITYKASSIKQFTFGGANYSATNVDSKTGKVTFGTTTDPVLKFNPGTGKFISAGTSTDGTLSLAITANTDTTNPFKPLRIDFSTITQYDSSGSSNLESTKGSLENKGKGKQVGNLSGISIDTAGKIFGKYDNGDSKLLGQLAVASFANPAGLESVGNSMFAETQNSGDFDGVGKDITSNGGAFTTGVLEMSNVDLSAQFTDMITTQRGFQANSRIITTSDTLLEELINLKR